MVQLMKERRTTLDATVATFAPLFVARPRKGFRRRPHGSTTCPPRCRGTRRTLVLDLKPEQYARYDASWKKLEQVLRDRSIARSPLVPEPTIWLASCFTVSSSRGWPWA